MRKVLLGTSVWIDGFVAGPNGGDGGLHDLLFSSAGGEAVAESVRNTGAILLGRHTHDQDDGLGGFAGSPYAVKHFVVPHRAPERGATGDGHRRGLGLRDLPDKSLRLRQGRAVQPDPLAILDRVYRKEGHP